MSDVSTRKRLPPCSKTAVQASGSTLASLRCATSVRPPARPHGASGKAPIRAITAGRRASLPTVPVRARSALRAARPAQQSRPAGARDQPRFRPSQQPARTNTQRRSRTEACAHVCPRVSERAREHARVNHGAFSLLARASGRSAGARRGSVPGHSTAPAAASMDQDFTKNSKLARFFKDDSAVKKVKSLASFIGRRRFLRGEKRASRRRAGVERMAREAQPAERQARPLQRARRLSTRSRSTASTTRLCTMRSTARCTSLR
jgi:hypothetical protein